MDKLERTARQAPGFPSRDPGLDVYPGFVSPPPGYGEVAFYWWVGEPLTKERLEWQLDQLKDYPITSLQINYAHSDQGGDAWGLTIASDPPLFSEAWWELFAWFAEKAGTYGISVSLSDYTLCWPGQGWYIDEILCSRPDISGYNLLVQEWDAGDGLLELTLPPGVLSVIAYRCDERGQSTGEWTSLADHVRGNSLHWAKPDGTWRAAAVYSELRPRSIDPMHPDSGALVISHFFQLFEERLANIPNAKLGFFFSDELGFGIKGRLWNDMFRKEFMRRKGYDLLPELVSLFLPIDSRTPKIRMDYADVLVALSEEHYFQPIFEWHEQRGMIYGCDHGGRGKDVTEFGDYFRTQRWNQGPGCDQPYFYCDLIKNKVASSIAHLYERPRTWLEGFYSSGWGSTTADLTHAIFRNFVSGHNLLTLHGLYYTTYGGWWEWAPPCNHFRMPYWKHMKPLLDCTERLSYLLSQGVHVCDVAVLYPVEAMEAGMDGEASVAAAFGIGEYLYKRGIDWDFIDFQSVDRSVIADRKLQAAGEAYRVLILPAMRAVRHSTLRKALEFYEAGGSFSRSIACRKPVTASERTIRIWTRPFEHYLVGRRPKPNDQAFTGRSAIRQGMGRYRSLLPGSREDHYRGLSP
ncbi:glycosyl hydrolase [Paenibacillus sp. CC-CFT747]|nr:glycosyl hydrolase [Paenibacillus sp. CC-CFT747]